MRQVVIASLVLGLCASLPATAKAQARVPHTESTALGLDVGAFVPSGNGVDQLDTAPMISGLYEYYVTPRVSLRASAGWTEPSVKGSPIDSVRQIPIGVDVNYNWEGGKWHPFVGAGLGANFMQFRRRGESLGESETKPSVNVGGGVEYFINRALTIKGEGRYHAMGDFGRIEPSGVAFTAGLKTYF